MKQKLLTLFAAALMLLGVQSVNAVTLQVVDGNNTGSIAKLVDGNNSTKWEGGFGSGCFVILKNAACLPIIPGSYTIVTGNDNASWNGRGWKAWKIYGANFAYDAAVSRTSNDWVLLDEKSNITQEIVPDVNSTPFDFNFSEAITKGYVYFKIEITELQGASYMQMCEFILNNCTVDPSVTNELKNYNLTGVDADLVSAYNAGLEALEAAADDAAVEAALTTLATLRQKIDGIKNGLFVALDWAAGAWGDGPGSNLVDKKESTKWGGNFQGSDPQYVIFRGQAMQPYFYKLVTGNDTANNTGRNWKTWKVFGGNFASEADATFSAEGWEELDNRENVTEEYLPMKNFYPAMFNFNKGVTKTYTYYKVVVYASGGTQQQMSEMYLCTQEEFEEMRKPLVDEFAEFNAGLNDLVVESSLDADKSTFATKYALLQIVDDAVVLTQIYNELVALREKLTESAAFVAGGFRVLSGNTGTATSNEGFAKLVDGNVNTKWCGTIPSATSTEPAGSYVIFKKYANDGVGQYMLVTGNDTKNSPGRNWKSWKIYGAGGKTTDSGATRDYASWTLIDEKTDIGQDQLPAANFAPAYFNFSETWSGYKYFKIEVEAAYGGGAGTLMQMAEFKMLSDEEYTAIRQEYVDSLTKVATAMLAEYASVDVPEALMAQIQNTAAEKFGAVAGATANELLPKFNDALNYITTEAPALVASAQLTEIDGVYQIANAYNLASFAALVNAGENEADAVVTADIDLSEVITGDAWTSIGNNSVPFKGTFDGQGYTIRGITFTAKSASGTDYNGLFGVISAGAVIKNFTAEGTYTVPASYSPRPAAPIVVVAKDENVLISNIVSKVNINAARPGAQLGGILGGSLNGSVTVDRCTYSGTLAAEDSGKDGNYGGIVGYANNNAACYLTISNCLFDGVDKNTAETPGNCTFGGMIGYSNGANVTIKNVLSIGTVQSTVAAQFFGAVKSTRSSITNSYYQGANVNGSASTVTLTGAVEVTDEQLASGYVCAKLGSAWGQVIGTDAYPVPDATKPVVVEITEAGYATLYNVETALTAPEGVSAYTAEFEETWLKLNAVEGAIAAGEPVVLKGAAGIYSFAPATGGTKVEGNVLKGAAEDVAAEGKYILAKPEGEPAGFYKASAGTIKAGKAYLEVAASGVKAFFFNEDDATGINNIETVNENGAIYNLAGQRLNKMQKGINIINGKKVLK
ncbi:MAG: hypothetical protein IKU02_02135 [Bacteroidaceae bacterium]|nr:hypothetical protein [Bacteroidaceae bacterium]